MVGFTGDPASRAVFLPFVRPKMLRIMAGTHQKDSCPSRTGKLNFLGDYLVFSAAPVSDSHLFGVRPWSTRLWIFLGDDIWRYSVFSSIWFNTGNIITSVYGGLWFRLQKTAESPQLQFIYGRRRSLRTSEADFHGPDHSADHRDPALAVRFWWWMSLLCGRAESQVPSCRRQSCSRSCSSLRSLPRLHV